MPQTKKLAFDYFPFPKKDPRTGKIVKEIFYPVIPLRISYGHKLGRPFQALVDSGADRNLFPIKAFTHKIKLYLGVEVFKTEADFSYEQGVPLLGRAGFFNLFKRVTFKESDRVVEFIIENPSRY